VTARDWTRDRERQRIRQASIREWVPLRGEQRGSAPHPQFKRLQGQWVVFAPHESLQPNQRLKIRRADGSWSPVTINDVSAPFEVYGWEMAYASIGDNQLPSLVPADVSDMEKDMAARIALGRSARRARALARVRSGSIGQRCDDEGGEGTA
jgi:hypothetical protein